MAILAAGIAGGNVLGRAVEKPNIILILVDDLGRESVGCYGGESYATPAIDALAEDGLKFEHFYASPMCHPTRAALVSGRYLHSIGNPKWGYFPSGEIEQQTVAHVLKKAGYATVASGKWHLQMLKDDPAHPHRLGFDEYCFFGWHEGPRFWQPHIWQNGQLRDDVSDRFGPDVYYEFLMDFIQQNRDRPFFAFYSMTLAHAVSNDLVVPPPHGPNGRYMSFAEMLEKTDYYVGKLRAEIESLGIAENTLIFFTTDNGTSAKNYIRHEGIELITEPPVTSRIRGVDIVGQKTKFNDWGVRVPTIAYWPRTIKPGQSTAALADVTDLLVTFNEVAGQSPLSFPVDGKSFAPVFQDASFGGREWVSFQMKDKIAVRTRDWKLLSSGEFFDMRGDPIAEVPLKMTGEDPEAENGLRHLKGIMNTLPKP